MTLFNASGDVFINYTLAGTLKDGSFPVQPHAFVSIALSLTTMELGS